MYFTVITDIFGIIRLRNRVSGMFVMTVLETTNVTSTLCSVTQVLPHSQMLVFVVFHTYMHTHAHTHQVTLKLPP